MGTSLDHHATSAAEVLRSFERALAEASAHWNDATRQQFDQRHTEPALASSRRTATELAELARELRTALVELNEAER